ncbi:MAG TPA: hypothetical protein VIH57_03255 [Bacteroidales bacterium]|jgi:hypothetical protein
MNKIRRRRPLSKTVVNTEDIVENSFWQAIERVGLLTSKEYISYMKGWPIWFAFETLCNKLMPYAKEKEIRRKVDESFSVFRKSLETYCKMHKLRRDIRSFLMHPENIRIYSRTA